jgi:O-antigen/teichoic acid export membrane protein
LAEPSLRRDVRGLARKSIIYGVGSVLVRGVSLFVLPLYTRFLSPSEYGTVALGTTLTALLSIVFPLGLQNAIGPFFYSEKSETERKRRCGTIWLTMVIAALVLAVLLDQLGAPLFTALFPKLSYSPFVRLAIWTAFLNVFALFPLNVAQIRERAGEYVFLTGASVIVTVAFVVVFVVFLHKGAYGYMLGALLANSVLAVPFIFLAMRESILRIDRRKLRPVLGFSLPLIVHGIASWALSLSDRAILQRYVSLFDLGVYSVGYQIGSVMIMIGMAIANAWNPFLFRRAAEAGESAKPGLSKLVTYFTMTIAVIAVFLCLFAREIIDLLSSQSFHAAYSIVPIVVAAYFWNSLYVVPAGFLLLEKKTNYLPIATVIAGILNVTLNFLFVPRFGIIAAAWSTFWAFLVLFLIVWLVALRTYPFPYEYGRISIVIAFASALVLLGVAIATTDLGSVLLKLLLVATIPVALAWSPFLRDSERRALRSAVASARNRITRAAGPTGSKS